MQYRTQADTCRDGAVNRSFQEARDALRNGRMASTASGCPRSRDRSTSRRTGADCSKELRLENSQPCEAYLPCLYREFKTEVQVLPLERVELLTEDAVVFHTTLNLVLAHTLHFFTELFV